MLLCSSKAVSFDGSAPTIVWGSGSPPGGVCKSSRASAIRPESYSGLLSSRSRSAPGSSFVSCFWGRIPLDAAFLRARPGSLVRLAFPSRPLLLWCPRHRRFRVCPRACRQSHSCSRIRGYRHVGHVFPLLPRVQLPSLPFYQSCQFRLCFRVRLCLRRRRGGARA